MPNHDVPPPRGKVRHALHEMGRGPNKRLGQHFLARAETAQRIVDLARLTNKDRVVEIGPGLGALTEMLARTAGELWLVEVDRQFADALREKYAPDAHVHVIEADVLTVDFVEMLGPGTPAIVVANLPYNISTAILFRLLEAKGAFQRFVIMVQREVAERLRALPNTDAYSGLSVMAQSKARVTSGMKLGPGAFVPPPKVDSEVVLVEPYDTPPVPIVSDELFERVVRTAFNQRRKQLGNSLRSICDEPTIVLAAAKIDPMRRPETLSLAEFAELTKHIGAADRDA